MTEPEDLAWRIEKPRGERRAEVTSPPGTTLSLVFYLRLFGHQFLGFWAKPEPRPRVPVSAWLIMALLGICVVLGWSSSRGPKRAATPSPSSSPATARAAVLQPVGDQLEDGRFRVVCIVKPDRSPRKRIQEFGLEQRGGGIRRVAYDEALTQVASSAWSLYVQPPGVRSAEVIVDTSRPGNPTLKTESDGIEENNLSELPECR